MIGLCMMVDGEPQCKDHTFVPDFSTETACEVHSILQTTLINYDLVAIDNVYDIWTAPSECVDVPMRPELDDFYKKLN